MKYGTRISSIFRRFNFQSAAIQAGFNKTNSAIISAPFTNNNTSPKNSFSSSISPPTRSRDNTIKKMVADLPVGVINCLKRFTAGGMSYGSISYEAHTTIAEAMNRMAMAIHHVDSMGELKKLGAKAGPMSNSGEGGELEIRNDTFWQSRVRQVASGRFGVNISYLANAVELQIKVNQGAKPGIGGELPGLKVNEKIAAARLATPGTTLASPPPHHDIYSIEDLTQLIYDIRSANPSATISVKLAASDGIGVIAAGVAKCGADNISIAGPGGTGAAPLTAKYEFVHPWEAALAEVHQTLTAEGLRASVTLTVSGGLQTGLDYFKALLLGADYIEGGTSVLVSLGCVLAEVCHDGTCPTGIATQNQKIIDEKFKGKPEDVARLLINAAKSLHTYLQKYGFTDPGQAVGRTDILRVKDNAPIKNLEKLLDQPLNPYVSFGKLTRNQGSSELEKEIITRILKNESIFEVSASNRDLSFGARIAYFSIQSGFSSFFLKPIRIQFNGLAVGQSFGFVAPPKLKLVVENSNDGTGKSLDGAEIYAKHMFGNQTGYGATRGALFARFMGDRTGVRNSGAEIVTEQVGDMAANFMTGGTLTIVGSPFYYPQIDFNADYTRPNLFRKGIVGPNLGAGFSGGIIYLPKELYHELKKTHYFSQTLYKIKPQPLGKKDEKRLTSQLKKFNEHIPSPWIGELIEDPFYTQYFVKLDPTNGHDHANGEINLNLPRKKEEVHHQSSKKNDFQLRINIEASPNKDDVDNKNQASTESMSMYDSSKAKDACGIGTLVSLNGQSNREISEKVLEMLARMTHRGSAGVDANTGDGCGITWYGLDEFFQKSFPSLDLKKGCYSIVPMSMTNDAVENKKAMDQWRYFLSQQGLSVAAERSVPMDRCLLGFIGRQQEYSLSQCVVLKPNEISQEKFEKRLIIARMHFEFSMRENASRKVRPHIFSASSYYVIYKSLVKENKFGKYFIDFSDPDFKASAGVSHARFATNTSTRIENVQPFKFAHNGENNALQLIVRLLTADPLFTNTLQVENMNLNGLSDSHIMALLMDMLHLFGYSIEDICALTIHPYDPENDSSSNFYNLFGVPFEGPNASVISMGDKVLIVRDKNGFRPQRGVLSETLFYCGSELGPVDIQGELFDLPPGKPLVIDLTTGDVSLYEAESATQQFHQNQLERLKTFSSMKRNGEPVRFSQDELEKRRLRAGWHDEFNIMVMQPLFQAGKGSTSSMADQGPIEALVPGVYFDFSNLFKGKFSQVTNPPLAKKEEEAYMSTLTFVGKKPSLQEVGKVFVDGYLLSTPIVSNHELAHLQADHSLKTHTLSITFPIHAGEKGMQTAIDTLCKEAVKQVKKGTILLVLSDLGIDENNTVIPPAWIASLVDQALVKAGLRKNVSIAIQAGSLLAGRDVAQAISIGGADIVNPYLAFIPNNSYSTDPLEFENQCNIYKESLRQELLGFMARFGISTVSAYRGTKLFNAYGLDHELADMLGISSVLGGLGWHDIYQIILTNHMLPATEGLGKYRWEGQEARRKIWAADITNNAINSVKNAETTNEHYKRFEEKANLLKSGWPRGWLRLVEPKIWNNENPMPVCILGGGAAGFYQTRLLLDSGLPVKIIIIEQKHGNKFGLVGDGVAPDHSATKNQANLLRECLRDDRVQYFGGIEVGKRVTYQYLKEIYPCIIDCRGATEDIKLEIEGEEINGVLSASTIYKSYNNEFYPFTSNDWPFNRLSKNPVIGIIGSGNVAADIARILTNPDDLESTNINPIFLHHLQAESPMIVRIFSRGNPTDSKISLNELKNLESLGIIMAASFEINAIDFSNLTNDQKELYSFFSNIKNKPYPTKNCKIIHFHFQLVVKAFRKKGNEIEAVFLNREMKEIVFEARNYITAIGRRPAQIERPPYASGWVVGKGGTLQSAEESAKQTTETIKQDFENGIFHHRMSQASDQQWQLRSSVGNKEFESILDWIQDGHVLRTVMDFFQARHYVRTNDANSQTVDKSSENTAEIARSSIAADNNSITLISKKSGTVQQLPVKRSTNLLVFFKENVDPTTGDVPKHECNGAGVCGTCVVEVKESSQKINRSKKETALLKGGLFNPNNHIISCEHKTDEVKGAVLKVK